jgi:hypothetical protein
MHGMSPITIIVRQRSVNHSRKRRASQNSKPVAVQVEGKRTTF